MDTRVTSSKTGDDVDTIKTKVLKEMLVKGIFTLGKGGTIISQPIG